VGAPRMRLSLIILLTLFMANPFLWFLSEMDAKRGSGSFPFNRCLMVQFEPKKWERRKGNLRTPGTVQGHLLCKLNNLNYLVLYILAEVHGNRTHPPPCSDGALDLKSRRATSALSTSAGASIPYSLGAGEENLLGEGFHEAHLILPKHGGTSGWISFPAFAFRIHRPYLRVRNLPLPREENYQDEGGQGIISSQALRGIRCLVFHSLLEFKK
jgi:hypothetical protein